MLAGASSALALWEPARAQTSNTVPDPAINLNDSQDISPKPSGTAATLLVDSSPKQLEEIVVTSTKRNQSARDIPSTVNVLTGAKLEKEGARDLEDFVDQVPGLKIEDSTTTSSRKIIIRGIGPDDTTNQTVGTVLGDVPLGDPFGSYTVIDPDPWDLKDVEVLKGPQGTLFGASSLAGLIRYVPNDPVLGEWEGKAFSSWTSIKEGGIAPTFGAALNIPIGRTFALRGSGILEHNPGVIDIGTLAHETPNADYVHKWQGRIMALWQPVKRLTINAWYMEQETHADEPGFVTNFNGELMRNDAPTSSPSHRAFALSTLDTRYAFDWATLVSLTGYQHKVNQFKLDASYIYEETLAQQGIESGAVTRHVQANGVVQELRLVSPDTGPWTWVGGVFYSQYRADIESDIYVPNTSILPTLINPLPADLGAAITSSNGVSEGNQELNPANAGEEALFGELTRAFGPVSLTLGGRLFRTDVNAVSNVSGALATVTNGTPDKESYLDVIGLGFGPKAAISWHVFKDDLIYASASRGFQYGGVNVVALPIPTDVVPPTYKSSTLWSYETGVRTEWLHKTLRADLTGFYQQWKDAQVNQASASTLDVYVDNVGQVLSRGFEWSFRYLLPVVKGLSIETNGDYLESKTITPFTNSSGVTVPSGTDMPNAPRLQISANLAYSHLFDGRWRTQTALEFAHTNTGWNDIEHDHLLDTRNMFNLNFSVYRSDLNFAPTVSIVVNNITSQKKIVSVTEGSESAVDLATEGIPVAYTRPRTVIVRASVDF